MRCPDCNSILKKRKGKDGEEHLVCSNYPFCKYNADKVYTFACKDCGKMECTCNEVEDNKYG